MSALGAEVKCKCTSENDGSTKHCILEINNAQVHLTGETIPALNTLARTAHTNRLQCHMELADPHAAWAKALSNGATSKIELKEQFWGGLYGSVVDKMGFEWSFSNVRPEEDEKSKSGMPGIHAYILTRDGDAHIEWIQRVFEGEVKLIYRNQETKKVMHCDIVLSGGRLFLADSSCGPEGDHASKTSGDGKSSTKVMVHITSRDPDPIWERAMSDGAEQVVELKKQFWGGYFGCFRDPYGVQWAVLKSCGQ